MSNYIGIDTSNYTTSVAVYNSTKKSFTQEKKLLPVKSGSIGLRQSDAVFHHVQQLPDVIEKLLAHTEKNFSAIGVSSSPRDDIKSYMPCFTVGISSAKILSSVLGIKCYEFSHQAGHIAAVLFGSNKLDLLNQQFIAFHVSGGTTEAVLVTPDDKKIIRTKIIGKSLDLKAGQLIDRVGVRLNLQFPAGPELEKLALTCDKSFRIKTCLKGFDCCLSGVENMCENMINQNESPASIALFTIKFIERTLEEMCKQFLTQFKNIPFVFSGGVMSNSIIQKTLKEKFDGIFADKSLSSDNAVGTAILTSQMHERS